MQGNSDAAAVLGIAFLIGICAAMLTIVILYMLALQRALSRCHPRNRKMEPGMVWMLFIPLFNIVWQFFVVNRIAESLKREYRARGLRPRGDFGAGVGLAFCILGLLAFIPILGGFLALASMICQIIFWVKIAGCSSELARDGRPVPPRYPDEDDYDYYDDRPRRSHRDDRDEDDEYDDRPRRSSRPEREDDEYDDRPRTRSSRDDQD